MSGPSSIVQQASVPLVLRQHRDRISVGEAQVGQWVYAQPIAPASDPPNYMPGDPLERPLLNGVTNRAFEQPVSYRIHPATKVELRGQLDLNGASLPVKVLTLPPDFCPTQGPVPVLFPSSDGSLIYTGRIDVNGDVWILNSVAL